MQRATTSAASSRDRGKCRIEVPGPFALVIFGASGDLTRRKILPAVFRLFANDLLPENFFIIGAARSQMDDEGFRRTMKESCLEALGDTFDQAAWDAFVARLYYSRVTYTDPDSCNALASRMIPLEKKHGTQGNKIFYLAVPPSVYAGTATGLGEAGLASETVGYTHIVIEKPFGRDLKSASELNRVLGKYFNERQIYRMDHYLAKETVQNILMFRFANSMFEPLWNQRYIDHVEITVSETLGVEHRAGYYEQAGILRDMFQNHIFQLLALTAMEPPSRIEADRVRDEKVKVFRSVRPFDLSNLKRDVVIAQYGPGLVDDRKAPAYRDEEGVGPESVTPTFCAMRVFVDNWRWNGVPFYLRSGKRLNRRKAEISIHFRQAPHLMFSNDNAGEVEPNTLVLRLQPDEGINLMFQTKLPGTKLCMDPVLMDFSYPDLFTLEAYERVLLDCMGGDQMLFVRGDAVDTTWRLLTPVIERLEERAARKGIALYAAGTEGPEESFAMLAQDDRRWRPI